MAGPLIYNVLTEFRFEIGSALLGSEKLAGAVDQVSTAADNALYSFQKLGLGIVASFGLGTGGVLGLLGVALQVSDKFAQSQRDIANIITSNTGGTMSWVDALTSAEATMQNINKKAAEFGLSSSDLMSTTKQIGAVLLSHGLDKTDLGKSVDISRQYLKSAPTLGIDPASAQQQLVRAVLGDASGNDTLFNRMTGETAAMKEFGAPGGTKKFNALDPAKRLDVLTKSLAQFSSNANYVHGNALSLNNEMKRLGELIKGTFSIFKSLGDVLIEPVKMVLHAANNYIAKEGKQIVDSFAKFFKDSLKDPKAAIASLFQASRLKSDIAITGKIFGAIGLISGLVHVLGMLGITIPIVSIGFGTIAAAMATIAGIMAAVTAAFVYFFAAITRILVPMALMVMFFQLISRAIAYAKIADASALAELAPRLAEVMRLLKFIFQPLFDAFDAVAQFIAPIFQVSLYARILINVLEFLATTLLLARATFQGFIYAVMEMINQLMSFFTGGGFDFGKVREAFNAGIDDLLNEALGNVNSGDAVVNSVTNIGKVEIKNQFKENLEPDRIAFSLTKQLMKVAQNPTQAKGRQFAPVGSGA